MLALVYKKCTLKLRCLKMTRQGKYFPPIGETEVGIIEFLGLGCFTSLRQYSP